MGEKFNGCEYLLDRRLDAGDGDRLAITGPCGKWTYAALSERVDRTAGGLRELGLGPEQRIVLFMADSLDLVTVYLAAMRIGAIPVPVSTMQRSEGLAGLLNDSRARFLAVTRAYAATAAQAAGLAPELKGVVADEGAAKRLTSASRKPVHSLEKLAEAAPAPLYDTDADAPAFWLYTSGTTGHPKGAMHRHGSIREVCETYGQKVLGIRKEDRCLSAAKAFFAYGLGNSILFPFSVGAATLVEPEASRPELMSQRARDDRATLFFAGPTFFANMLRANLPSDALGKVRLATSAGEPLPTRLYERWTSHFGVDIIDGIGMTETLHIFLSNREGKVKPGTTGVAVPGYDLKILDDKGALAPQGTPGTLFVKGRSMAMGYWCNYDASRLTFQGEWLRTGDTYVQEPDGHYKCLGRTGDMIKSSGIWVSPQEVETRLLAHRAVSAAIVVASTDRDGLEKPIAYVRLEKGESVDEAELIEFCREGLPSIKRPRRVVLVEDFPTTATGKVRRVELRRMAADLLTGTG